MTRLYGTNEWHEDLKYIFGRASFTFEQNVVFLFADSEVSPLYYHHYNINTFK